MYAYYDATGKILKCYSCWAVHLPHGITHCYLPPDTGERAAP